MATYTTNYNLPKYEASDLPNLLDQYNSAMDKIDAQLKNTDNAATQAGTAAGTAATTAQQALTLAQTNETSITSIESDVTSIESEQTSQAASISDHEQRITAVQGDVTELSAKVDQNTAGLATKAPIMHASTVPTYGLGTGANFGHVKLSDTPTDSSASAGIAATPKAIQDAIAALHLTPEVLHTGTLSAADGDAVTGGTITYLVIRYGNLLVISSHTVGFATSKAGSSTAIATDYTIPSEMCPTNDTGQCAYATDEVAVNTVIKPSGQIQFRYLFSEAIRTNDYHGNAIFVFGIS